MPHGILRWCKYHLKMPSSAILCMHQGISVHKNTSLFTAQWTYHTVYTNTWKQVIATIYFTQSNSHYDIYYPLKPITFVYYIARLYNLFLPQRLILGIIGAGCAKHCRLHNILKLYNTPKHTDITLSPVSIHTQYNSPKRS